MTPLEVDRYYAPTTQVWMEENKLCGCPNMERWLHGYNVTVCDPAARYRRH